MLVKTYHIGNAVVHINDEAYAQKMCIRDRIQ